MDVLVSLLNIDDTARAHGCGLNPKLRDAIERQKRFPSVAASPMPQEPVDVAALPENVTLLQPRRSDDERKSG